MSFGYPTKNDFINFAANLNIAALEINKKLER